MLGRELTVVLSADRAPFATDCYTAMLASQKKLLKHLIVLDKVIESAKLEGKGIYALLLPGLLSSIKSIKVEVLGCIEELLLQLAEGSSTRKRYLLLTSCYSPLL